jgi:CheY-like chemotaxis protein
MPALIEDSSAPILIVDDQPSNVCLLEHILRRGGYSAVTSTNDPRKVPALHLQNRYALIILDLQMPHMNGFEVMASLKSVATGILVPILVMSANPAQMVTALEAGAASFLGKPFVLADVLLHVHHLLDKPASLDIAKTAAVAAALPIAKVAKAKFVRP